MLEKRNKYCSRTKRLAKLREDKRRYHLKYIMEITILNADTCWGKPCRSSTVEKAVQEIHWQWNTPRSSMKCRSRAHSYCSWLCSFIENTYGAFDSSVLHKKIPENILLSHYNQAKEFARLVSAHSDKWKQDTHTVWMRNSKKDYYGQLFVPKERSCRFTRDRESWTCTLALPTELHAWDTWHWHCPVPSTSIHLRTG